MAATTLAKGITSGLRAAMEQAARAARVAWVEEERADTSTSATSEIHQTLVASRGRKIFLAVWRWIVRGISRMAMAGIKRLARIGLARMRAFLR